MTAGSIKKELRKNANLAKAKVTRGFFKTGKGQYGEGDVFLGLTSKQTYVVAQKYKNAPLSCLDTLLKSKVHEDRVCALRVLVFQFQTGDETIRRKIYNFYLTNAKKVNSWDLVDLSADKIIGVYLVKKDKKILYKLAVSTNLWERRIAIVATFNFIKNNQFGDTLGLAKILLNDKHDLIHKAVGWMLREVGKRDREAEEKFLRKYYQQMPRTMLRYSIEKFPENLRQQYLTSKITIN